MLHRDNMEDLCRQIRPTFMEISFRDKKGHENLDLTQLRRLEKTWQIDFLASKKKQWVCEKLVNSGPRPLSFSTHFFALSASCGARKHQNSSENR